MGKNATRSLLTGVPKSGSSSSRRSRLTGVEAVSLRPSALGAAGASPLPFFLVFLALALVFFSGGTDSSAYATSGASIVKESIGRVKPAWVHSSRMSRSSKMIGWASWLMSPAVAVVSKAASVTTPMPANSAEKSISPEPPNWMDGSSAPTASVASSSSTSSGLSGLWPYWLSARLRTNCRSGS